MQTNWKDCYQTLSAADLGVERDSLIAAIDDVDKAYSQMKSKPYPQSYSRASFSRQNRNKCSLVMPVYVSHIGSPDIESIVYAMLDTV